MSFRQKISGEFGGCSHAEPERNEDFLTQRREVMQRKRGENRGRRDSPQRTRRGAEGGTPRGSAMGVGMFWKSLDHAHPKTSGRATQRRSPCRGKPEDQGILLTQRRKGRKGNEVGYRESPGDDSEGNRKPFRVPKTSQERNGTSLSTLAPEREFSRNAWTVLVPDPSGYPCVTNRSVFFLASLCGLCAFALKIAFAFSSQELTAWHPVRYPARSAVNLFEPLFCDPLPRRIEPSSP